MEIVYFNLKEHIAALQEIIRPCFKEETGIQYHMFESYLEYPFKMTHKKAILFYNAWDGDAVYRIKRIVSQQGKQIFLVALCLDDQQGINALEHGCDYALLLPFHKQQVVRCCLYLAKKHE